MSSPLFRPPRSPEKSPTIKISSPDSKKSFNFLPEAPSRKGSTIILPYLTKPSYSPELRATPAKGSLIILESTQPDDILNKRASRASIEHNDLALSPSKSVGAQKGSKSILLKLVKQSSAGSQSPSPTHSTTNASLLQKQHIEEVGKLEPNGPLVKRKSITKMDRYISSESPKKESKGQIYDYLRSMHTYVSSGTLAYIGAEGQDELRTSPRLLQNQSTLLGRGGSNSKKASLILPSLNNDSPSPDDMEGGPPRKKLYLDPFDELVKVKDGKMPYHLALSAQARQKIFQEVRKQTHEGVVDINSLIELKDKKIPQAKAKVMERVNSEDLKKKENDLKSRSLNRNAMYQYYALSKDAQKKIRAKLQNQLGDQSRFLKL